MASRRAAPPGAAVPASRRYVRCCRHCGAEHEARGARSWLRWYHAHLYGCSAFRDRHVEAVAMLAGAVAGGVVGIATAALLASRSGASSRPLPLGFIIGGVVEHVADDVACARCKEPFPDGARFCPNDGSARP